MKVDEFIRERVGYTPNERVRLLLKVSESKTYIDELTENEEEIVRLCIQYQWIKIDENGCILLTDLGKTIVKGAKEVYNLE